MSITTGVAIVALVATGALGLVCGRTTRRIRRLEDEVASLEEQLGAARAAAEGARADAADASVLARRAALAAGAEEPPPRLPLEPITGRVVRAVAFGAGARQALARAAARPWARRSVRERARR